MATSQVIVQQQLDINKAPMTPTFSRHETFHPRFGWLKKGFDLACEDSSLFIRPDASTLLGVGKNMVRSIRYWCNAFKVLEEELDSQTKKKYSFPTKFGKSLLADDGWDPFLENPASLWLLHWQLLKQPCLATSWYYFFNFFRHADFSPAELLSELSDFKDECFPKASAAQSSLKNDVSCLLRMYSSTRVDNTKPTEDSIDCPFAELSLVESVEQAKRYSFKVGKKETLPPILLAYTSLDFCADSGDDARTINLSRLLVEPGSPGCVFKLTESALGNALEEASSIISQLSLLETSGLVQLQFSCDPGELRDELLNSYYSHVSNKKV